MSSGPTSPLEQPPSKRGRSRSWSTQASGMELREFVRILSTRRGVIVASLTVSVLVSFLLLTFSRKEYSATATIEMNKESGSSLGLADLSGISTGLGEQDAMNVDLLTQQSVIVSDNTALRVVEDLKLDSIPPFAIPTSRSSQQILEQERGLPLEHAAYQRARVLRLFKDGLRVNLIKGTRLLTVTYTDTNPNRASAIANAVVDAYRNESTEARYQASSKTSAWLTAQLADLKQKVEDSQSKVDAFQRASGLAGTRVLESSMERVEAIPSTGSAVRPMAISQSKHFPCATGNGCGGPEIQSGVSDNVAFERLIELNRDLTSAEVARIAKEAIYRMTETQDPEVVLGAGATGLAGGLGANAPLSSSSTDMALLVQLRQQLAQVRIRRATAGTRYGAKNPVMLQLGNEEGSIEGQIRAELERIRSRAKNDLTLAQLAEDGIRRRIAEQEQAVDRVTAKTDRLILLREEAQSNREIYQDLYTKLEEASVTAGIKASNVTLVDPARTPAEPSYPRAKSTVGFGVLAGLAFGLVAAFTWDYFDDSIAIPEQVEQLTFVPVIGAIPDFCQKRSARAKYGVTAKGAPRAASSQGVWLLDAPRSQIAEAYRALRTALLLSRAERPPRTVLFMSGEPEEGKSTTCLNTAASFALQGESVLYLDADLRRARAHEFFGCTNEVGLSNCLASGLAYSEALKTHPGIDSLFLLPAGPHPPNPSELLGSKRFADLLSELKARFDYVFIDSPPVLLVTDAQLISPFVDGYVLVLRANRTSRRFLERSLALMRGGRGNALGIVMNAFNARSAAYSGYGIYGRGGGYYADERA